MFCSCLLSHFLIFFDQHRLSKFTHKISPELNICTRMKSLVNYILKNVPDCASLQPFDSLVIIFNRLKLRIARIATVCKHLVFFRFILWNCSDILLFNNGNLHCEYVSSASLTFMIKNTWWEHLLSSEVASHTHKYILSPHTHCSSSLSRRKPSMFYNISLQM